MNLNEFFDIVWRRKLILGAVTVMVLGFAIGALRVVTPQYESTATLVLAPTNTEDPSSIYFYQVLDKLTPTYADAATARTTLAAAQRLLPAGENLADISVRTTEGTGIIDITARDPDAETARRSAQADADALIARNAAGDFRSRFSLSQLDRAQTPTDPVFPRPTITLAVALLLGLGLGVGAALLRENLTTKVETPEALARIAGVPSFAEIPSEPALARVRSAQDLNDPKFRVVSEAFRDLRTNLLFTKGNLRSIVVTSPEGSHGKTTIAFGLAVSFARSGARTILLDGDLRKGRVSELLNVQRTPGVSEILRGHPFESAVRHTSLENLDFLTGGRLGEDPSELLMADFPGLLHNLERIYDMVVIDTTPLVPVSDARIIARFGKATLIVASAATTTRRQLRAAVERLELISVQPTAVVLNNYGAAAKSAYYGPPESTNGSGSVSSEEKPRRRIARL